MMSSPRPRQSCFLREGVASRWIIPSGSKVRRTRSIGAELTAKTALRQVAAGVTLPATQLPAHLPLSWTPIGPGVVG
jgi:hypothetical protein